MGWDPIGDIKKAVDTVVSPVSNAINREVSNFSNSVNATVSDAGRGDVGKFVADSATAAINITKAPFEVVYYGVRGDTGGVSRSVQRAVGSSINLSGTSKNGNIFNPMTAGIRVAQSDVGQYVLRNEDVKTATLGLSEDYAGLYRGSRTLQDSAYLSREDQNSALKLAAKAGAFAAIGQAGLLSGLVQNAKDGNVKGIVKNFTDAVGLPDISEYLPGTDSPVGTPKSSAPYGSASPYVSDPWGSSGYSGNNSTMAGINPTVPLLIGVGVLGFLVLRRLT